MPFFGWALWMNGDVAIERGATRSAKKMIADCVRYLKMGIRVNIFPEGTRSKTGQLGKFKDGAFTIAKEAGVEIQPVVINGTRSITANGKWWIVPNKFSIRVIFYVKIIQLRIFFIFGRKNLKFGRDIVTLWF